MKDTYDPRNIREIVDMYLDNELSSTDQKSLSQDLEADPYVQKVVRQEKTFRRYLKENLHRPNISTDFINSIVDQIKVK